MGVRRVCGRRRERVRDMVTECGQGGDDAGGVGGHLLNRPLQYMSDFTFWRMGVGVAHRVDGHRGLVLGGRPVAEVVEYGAPKPVQFGAASNSHYPAGVK